MDKIDYTSGVVPGFYTNQGLCLYEDQELRSIQRLIDSVLQENHYQMAKHGRQIRTAFEWLAYLSEEVGELSEVIIEAEYRGIDRSKVKEEAIQVATLALKIAEMMGG